MTHDLQPSGEHSDRLDEAFDRMIVARDALTDQQRERLALEAQQTVVAYEAFELGVEYLQREQFTDAVRWLAMAAEHGIDAAHELLALAVTAESDVAARSELDTAPQEPASQQDQQATSVARASAMTTPDDDPEDAAPLAMAQAAERPLQFVRALRRLREDSGRSFQQIANTAHGRLPKSTAHYMTAPERTGLPVRAELVELFVRGCGRPKAEVQAWVKEWQRIKGGMKPAKDQRPRYRHYDSSRSAAVQRYFTPTPPYRDTTKYRIAFSSVVLLVAIAALLQNVASLTMLAAAVMLVCGGVRDYRARQEYVRRNAVAEPKPSGAQMDSWLADDIAEVTAQAASQLKLNAELTLLGGDLVYPPEVLVGCPAEQGPFPFPVRLQQSNDGKVRANAYEVLVIFLTDDVITLYRCDLDFHTGEILMADLVEYPYRDVVGIATTVRPMPGEMAAMLQRNQEKPETRMVTTFDLRFVSGAGLSLNVECRFPDSEARNVVWAHNAEAWGLIAMIFRLRLDTTGRPPRVGASDRRDAVLILGEDELDPAG